MITLDAVRAAILSDKPWARLDELVRAELARGQTTNQVYESLIGMADEIDDTPGLSEDGSDAFGDTLDALTGMCHPDCQYRDPPNTTLPTEEEIAKLPRRARVAFAARCARRVLPLFRHYWPTAGPERIRSLEYAVTAVEKWQVSAHHPTEEARSAFTDGALDAAHAADAVCSAVLAASRHGAAVAEEDKVATTDTYFAVTHSYTAARLIANITPHVRRDFDHLARLGEWQHWIDDTPVPPEVFGPLWPEGPPDGWPADPNVPQRTDLPLELLSAARVLDQMTEDEAVNLFNAINAYYIARTGDRLTLEDLRPLIAAAVPAGV